jgi:hypothetical protein
MQVVEIISDQYNQVTKGRRYTVERINNHGMVFLLGITYPVPVAACTFVESEVAETNRFVMTRCYTVVERVVVENKVGTDVLKEIMVLDKQDVDCYNKHSEQVHNVSEWIHKNLG